MGRILPFSSAQAAELADPEAKRESTARAQCILLLGVPLQRRIADDGSVIYSIGMRRFETLEQVEDYLDRIGSDE